MILDEIVAYTRKKVEKEKQNLSINRLYKRLKDYRSPRDFEGAMKREEGLSIIAEVKKASPSKGIIRQDFHPIEIAEQYEKNEVQAVSVLTENEYFQGSLGYL